MRIRVATSLTKGKGWFRLSPERHTSERTRIHHNLLIAQHNPHNHGCASEVNGWRATSASADGFEPGAMVYRPYDWSGFYVGGQIGWKHNDLEWALNPAIPGAVNQAFSLDKDTAAGGFHGGLQYQWGAIVVGAEVAWNRDLRNDWASHVGYGVGSGGNAEARSNDLVTVGGKLGWTPMSHWLVYASGGWATAEIETAPQSFLHTNATMVSMWAEG